jgi:hypothetical protein
MLFGSFHLLEAPCGVESEITLAHRPKQSRRQEAVCDRGEVAADGGTQVRSRPDELVELGDE